MVILALFLQILPSPQPVRADIKTWLNRLFSRISIPDEVEYNENGEVWLGALPLLVQDADTDAGIGPCPSKDEHGNCQNVFDTLPSLFNNESADRKVIMENGKLNIVVPATLPVCQLSIKRPLDEQKKLTDEESLARQRACNYLMYLQNAATQESFAAKKIYLSTDPAGECLFLKNCRSKCSLSFGKLNYTVTLFDIASFLLPTGWMSAVSKVVNALEVVSQIANIYKQAKDIVSDGLVLVNDAMKVFSYLNNLYAALENLGGSLAGAIGAGPLVAIANIANSPKADHSVLKNGFSGFGELLKNFSNNMVQYAQAKGETQRLILGLRLNLINLKEGNQESDLSGIKKEPEVSFLFESNSQGKAEIDSAVLDYQTLFEDIPGLLKRISAPGQLIGETMSEVRTGTNPDEVKEYQFGEPVDTVYGNRVFSSCPNQIQSASNYFFSPNFYPMFSDEQSLSKEERGRLTIERTEPSYIQELLDCALGCGCTERVNYCEVGSQGDPDRDGFCQADANLNQCASHSGHYNYEKLDASKQQWRLYWERLARIIVGQERVNAIIEDPAHFIPGVSIFIEGAGSTAQYQLSALQYEIINKYYGSAKPFEFLKIIAQWDRSGETLTTISYGQADFNTAPETDYTDGDVRTRKNSYLQGIYKDLRLQASIIQYSQPAGNKICAFTADRIVPQQSNCPDEEGPVLSPEMQNFKELTEPSNVEETIKSSLNGFGDKNNYDQDVLDGSKTPWRALWEDIGRNILPSGWVDYLIVKHNGKYKDRDTGKEYKTMADRLALIQTKCIGQYDFLKSLKAFEADGYKDEDSRDRVFYQLKVFQVARTSANVFPVITCTELFNEGKISVPGASWLKTFQETYLGMTAMESFFERTRPTALFENIIKMLDCHETTGGCNLNFNNDPWREWWENQASFLVNQDWVKEQIRTLDKKATHLKMMETCVGLYNPLMFIAALDPDYPNPVFIIPFPGSLPKDIPALNGKTGYVNQYDNKVPWPSIEDKDGNRIGTKELVRIITEYYYDQARNSQAAGYDTYIFTESGLNEINKNLAALNFHEQDLELRTPERYIPSTDLYPSGVYVKYWQSEIWCDNVCDTKSQEKFNQSYEPSLVDYEWDARIQAMMRSSQDLSLVNEAVSANAPVDDPLLIFRMDRSLSQLRKAVDRVVPSFTALTQKVSEVCWEHQFFKNAVGNPNSQQKDCSGIEHYCCESNFDCQQKADNLWPKCGIDITDPNQFLSKYSSLFWNWQWIFGSDYSGFDAVLGNDIKAIKTFLRALQIVWQSDLAQTDSGMGRPNVERMRNTINQLPDWYNKDWIVSTIESYLPEPEIISALQNTETSIAQKFAANIAITKYLTQQLSQNLFNLKMVFDEGMMWSMPFYSPEDILEKVSALPSSSELTAFKSAIEKEFTPAYNLAKTDMFERLKNGVGEYLITYDKPLDKFTEQELCPEDIKSQGFLNRAACFEKKKGKTFEDMVKPLKAMAEIDKAIFYLTDANSEINGASSIRQSVDNLKPEIRTEVLQLNTDLVGDVESKILSGTLGKIWKKYDANAPSGKNQDDAVKIFNQAGGTMSWDEFKAKLLANPILALQNDFDNIESRISQIKELLQGAGNELSGFWGWSQNQERAAPYWTAISHIEYGPEQLPRLHDTVFGKDNLDTPCQQLSPLFGKPPAEIKEMCKSKSNGGKIDQELLNNAELSQQCDSLMALSPEEKENKDTIANAIQALVEQRQKIVTENCADGTTKDVKCPRWFCLNDNGFWGSGSENIDPFCHAVKNGQHPTLSLTGANTSNIVWDTSLQMKDREWPPKTQCPCQITSSNACFADKYPGAQALCIQTQQRMNALQGLVDTAPEELADLPQKCEELEYQRGLNRECFDFDVAVKTVKGDCNSFTGSQKENFKKVCENIGQNLCQEYKLHCWEYPGGNYSKLPDITSPNQEEALSKLRDVCTGVISIKTPLNEIMKVYSVLIGIRSGTLAFGAIKTSVLDAKNLVKSIGKFIDMIENLQKNISKAWNNENTKSVQGGVKLEPIGCTSKPAESHINGRIVTGPEGGQVCPAVSGLYGQLQSQFSEIRRNLHLIDLSRRVVDEVNFPLWKADKYIHIFDSYPVKYDSIDDIYDRAQKIKETSLYVWTLATAIDFANQRCTCGQSYCKLPFCVSGIPLTLSPLKDPYCSLVWLLRIPLVRLSGELDKELMTLPQP